MNKTPRFPCHALLFGMITSAMLTGCAAPEPKIDGKADPVFRKMCSVLDAAPALKLRVRASMDRPVDTGQLAQFHRTSDITMVRPDCLSAHTKSDDGVWSVWYRGKSLTVLDVEDNIFATEAVPGRVGEMLDYLVDKYDLVMPMADFLIGSTHESLLAAVDSGEYLGLHNVGDTACHHLLFKQESIDWQLWIDAGETAVPRKIVITYLDEPDQPQYIATMDNWDLSPHVASEIFNFSPPAGAKNVSMSDLVANR
ncbi:MAG: DUF2092 domain-containing protein [Planctomycetes bacterium]|nr:DUF2092 domain-containing protein [Planctomycetota bacterium]